MNEVFYHGASLADVARRTGRHEGTIDTLVRRGKGRLQHMLVDRVGRRGQPTEARVWKLETSRARRAKKAAPR